MSKAFTREDVDPPERSGRVRSASGLPPGAVNYITAAGAKRLRDELNGLCGAGAENAERISQLEEILASVTVVEPRDESDSFVAFGATVCLRDRAGNLETYRVVGVDELGFETRIVIVSRFARAKKSGE
jgi:hypothetical protein